MLPATNPCDDCNRKILCNECEVFMDQENGIVKHTLKERLPAVLPMQMCGKCDFELPATPDYFHRSATRKSGLQNVCKNCKSEIDRKRNRSKTAIKDDNLQKKCQEVRAEVLGPKSLDALYQLLDKMEAEERSTLAAKGNDYSGDNRLANFERIGEELQLSPEKILWIYFKKHTDRLRTYITEGAVSSESVVDSIMDCRNYLALLRLMIEARA